MENTPIEIPIKSDVDIVSARQRARDLAKAYAYSSSELAGIATAISELARNIVSYAQVGKITIKMIEEKGRNGIMVIAEDNGPGIQDVKLAMCDGYSTSNSLGLGLPGVKRLMDDFEIESELGKGTRIIIKKWAA